VQAANAAPSSEQRNVAVASPSVNEKLAVVWFVVAAGCEPIDGGGGGVVSTVHVNAAGVLELLAASTA
jgi:hypothetical protein